MIRDYACENPAGTKDTNGLFAELHIFASVENHTLQLIKFIPYVVGVLAFILYRTPTTAAAFLCRKYHDEYYQIKGANKGRKKRLPRTYETASFKNFTI